MLRWTYRRRYPDISSNLGNTHSYLGCVLSEPAMLLLLPEISVSKVSGLAENFQLSKLFKKEKTHTSSFKNNSTINDGSRP